MRVSDNEVKKVLGQHSLTTEVVEIEEERVRQEDEELIQDLVKEVASMPDREEWIAELRSRIEAGTYKPTAEEIVDSMVRRSIVDNYR